MKSNIKNKYKKTLRNSKKGRIKEKMKRKSKNKKI